MKASLQAFEGSIMVCALVMGLLASIVFAVFELSLLQRRLRQHRKFREEARVTDIAACIASVGMLGGALATAALMFNYGAEGKARPWLFTCSTIAGILLIFVISALGCDQKKRCKERRSVFDKTVGLIGLVLSLMVIAAATVRLKYCWR